MNAKHVDRLDQLETRAIKRMTDAELEAMTSGEYEWMRELTDHELDALIAGGPVSPRVDALMNTEAQR